MMDTRKGKARVVVVGGANVDIQGQVLRAFIPGDSNPGRIVRACGGVGRNIAENCARLGMPTWFIAASATTRTAPSSRTAASGSA